MPMLSLANYIHATPDEQVELLRQIKDPPEGRLAQLIYYKPARRDIRGFHTGKLTREQLEAKIARLRAQAEKLSPRKRPKPANTADVIERYRQHHGDREPELLSTQKWDLTRGEVRITAAPTLIARKKKATRLIFLQFGKDIDKKVLRTTAQLAHFIINMWDRRVAFGDVQVIDVRSGAIYDVDRVPAVGQAVQLACKTMTNQWHQIDMPTSTRKRKKRPESRQVPIDLHPDPDIDGTPPPSPR